jgi:hypothetical protein
MRYREKLFSAPPTESELFHCASCALRNFNSARNQSNACFRQRLPSSMPIEFASLPWTAQAKAAEQAAL